MQLMGNYPFTTHIWNFFPPGSGVKLKVTFYHRRCYFDKNYDFKAEHIEKDAVGKPFGGRDYIIEGGMSLMFPMFFADETLVLSLDVGEDAKPLTTSYRISAGLKAKCIPNEKLGKPEVHTFIKKVEDEKECEKKCETFYMGGSWKIESTNKEWQLTIKKYGPDPENEDVTLGPDPPPQP